MSYAKHANHVLSFSGGKDSTAMLLMMLERGEPIHSVVWFDTGWEFPQMVSHIDQLERATGVKIVRLTPDRSYDYWMFERPIVARKGPAKGKIHRIGNGWPSPMRRWCTRIKVNTLDRYLETVESPISCIGFAADEAKRCDGKTLKARTATCRYPLIEWGITEADALAYCKAKGYTWGGLYDHFRRVSCFCCPLQRIGELRTLRACYPDLWQQMLDMDERTPTHNRGFRGYQSVADLNTRFASEERQARAEPTAA